MSNVLSERTMSGFPLSIGTGIAMETLFSPKQDVYDPKRDVPDKLDLTPYSQIWINTSTLLRNMTGAMKSSDAQSVSVQDYAQAIKIEMEVIRSLFKEEHPNIEVVFYFNDYKKLFTSVKYAKVIMRNDNSAIQKQYTQTLLKVMDSISKEDESLVLVSGMLRPKVHKAAVMLTHHAFDLLSRPRFGLNVNSLILLESHSGSTKKFNKWYTKLYPVPGADMSRIPFYPMTLYVFGDKSLIMPQPMSLRKLLIDISVKRKWTPFTTMDKIKFDIENDVKEHMVRHFLLSLPTPN